MRNRGTKVSTGVASEAGRAIDAHVRYRFRKWWGAEHKTHKFGPC